MVTRLLVLLLVAGATAAAALAAGEFKGTARALAPTASEARFRALTASTPTDKPPADKRTGWRSGWQASYLKGTTAKPIEAFVLVYVYDTTAHAGRAYARSCAGCKGAVRVSGIAMKFQLTGGAKKTMVDLASCRNVYTAVAISGRATANALARDAGGIVGAVFRRAVAGGMKACSS